MAQTQAAGGPSEPDETAGGVSDSPESWPGGGVVGDGRYRLTRRLGRGGMAEVFAAEDVRLGRTVAVKLLRADLAEDPVSKARFTREAQSVAGLNHHAVVAVYDSGEDVVGGNTVPYIVMELVEGRTIRDLLLNADAPPPDQALIIISGVLEALAYSHQHGIVHRDIKPANVIITTNGAVKVMDFGIARALHGASTTMTQTGMVMGTPQYLSPEQALGKTVDARSDLYATGCMLYELLALRPPFTGETPLSVVYQHVQDDPVPPSEVSDAVPPELDGLVMRSLAKDPDDRFQTAEEMRGLVQYALRMLQEQGGHTGGLWNTGAVISTGATPAMGTPGVYPPGGDTPAGATTAMAGVPDDGTRVGPPLLMGSPGGGSYGGGAHDSGGYGGEGRGGGVKYALIAFFAVLAVAAGVIFALNGTGDDGETKPPSETSSTPTERETSPEPTEEEPTEEPTEEETTDPGGTGGWQNGGGGGGWEQPSDPQTEGSSSPTGEPTTGGQDGGTDEGTDQGQDGGTDEGTDQGQDGGTTDGGTDQGQDGGTADGGNGDTGPGTTTEGQTGTTTEGQTGTTTGGTTTAGADAGTGAATG
ncbi:protein kinase [Streptomyces sp. TRM43335]|uniref:non-specific serine/threonine protein kinase n=1 Tax=Streptomyces taklimakanensis TaxID=2569853 RepID=A0A6G2BCG2_9ACTN|nr:protein kinase [Streptomyces taklimakanensis]MTE19940.1 protein kinase [Streptomyces taklimakanensis]